MYFLNLNYLKRINNNKDEFTHKSKALKANDRTNEHEHFSNVPSLFGVSTYLITCNTRKSVQWELISFGYGCQNIQQTTHFSPLSLANIHLQGKSATLNKLHDNKILK